MALVDKMLGTVGLHRGRKIEAEAPARVRRGRITSVQQVRGYNAASVDRLTAAFGSQPRTFDSHTYSSLRTLRARCREAARDEGIAKRFLGLLVNNVVGADGIALQSRPLDESSGQLDQLAADGIEEAFREWGKPRNCDIRQRLGWVAQQRLALRTVARDGEALIEEVLGSQAGPFGYALNQLDPELLDMELNMELRNGNRIVMGIEVDKYDRPVAYHLITPGSSSADLVTGGYYHGGRNHRRVPAERIIHLYLTEDPAQHRGIPWMSTALYRMQQLGAGIDAATINFRVGAMKVAFITTPEGEAPITGDNEADGSPIDDLEPGTVEYLAEGQTLNSWDPIYPNNELRDFIKGIKRDMASGLETSYSSLASDLEGVSFSAGRIGRLDDIDTWQGVQSWLALALNQRVYERFLLMGLTAGVITVPSRAGDGPKPLKIERIEKYKRSRWQGRGWDSVDELKTITAATQAIAIGVSTVSEQIRKRGRDPQELFRERSEELIYLQELGITPPTPALTTIIDTGGDTQPQTEEP